MDNTTKSSVGSDKMRYEVSMFEKGLIQETHSLKKKAKKQQKGSLFYIGYVGQVGFVIAIPIAGGAAIGSYADSRWGTYPKMTLIGLSIGIFISIVNFIAVIKEIINGSKN